MHNITCAPEMASNPNVEDEPHAYVKYKKDGAKEIVPLSFIYKFPPLWRECGWDKDYLFKVFWSSNDEDSPSNMLKRCPSIPVYEDSTADLAGYYRATVLKVEENRATLETVLEGKRIRIGQLPNKYTSFDFQSASNSKKGKTSSSSDFKKAKKSTVKKIKHRKDNTAHYTNTKELRTEIVRHYPELGSKETLSDSSSKAGSLKIEKITPNRRSTRKPIDASKSEVPSKKAANAKAKSDVKESNTPMEKSDEPIDASKLEVPSKRAANAKVESDVKVSNTPMEKSDAKPIDASKTDVPSKRAANAKAESVVKESNTSMVKSDEPIDTSKLEVPTAKAELSDHMDTDLDFEGSNTFMVKSDEPIDAAKLEAPTAEAELSDHMDTDLDLESDNTTKVKSSASDSEISAERESKKFISRSKVVKPGTPTSQNKGRRRRKSHSSSSSDDNDNVKRIKVDPDYTPRKYTEAVFELQRRQSTIKRISNLNLTLQEKLLLEEAKNADLQKEIDALMASCKCKKALNQTKKELSAPPVKVPQVPSSKRCLIFGENISEKKGTIVEDSTFDDALFSASKFCKVEMHDEKQHVTETENDTFEDAESLNTQHLDTHSSQGTEVKKEAVDTESWDLSHGVTVEQRFVRLLNSIPGGERKDLKFVKDLAVIAFGPEVLAASSVDGTRKGGKRDKTQGAPEARPALNPGIVSAIRRKLLERVEKEEGTLNCLPDEHNRLKKTRFNQIIRQVQKKVRAMGYGQGTKSNTVTQDVLMGNDEI